MKLEGKTAIVSGGGAGIGRGIVFCLAEEGADVAIVDIDEETAAAVADEVKKLGRKSSVIIADVTDSKQVSRAVQETLDGFGKIDILVNNTGGESRFYYEKEGQPYLEEKEWDDTVKLNLKTTMLMCRAVSPHFVEQKSGKIVNISSIGGRAPAGVRVRSAGTGGSGASFSPMTSYAAAKAGVIQFTRVLALQLAEYNINVNCICPGVLYTPLYERSVPRRIQATPEAKGMTPREYFDAYLAPMVPLKREQTPEDIGRAVVFLVSEDARNITGQSINVDGGMVPN
jgi:meso-butanediol dehydrogenase/(S,S)-butanediol dehydrogenase/diacetyl reductase